jgi:hypothetical protein
MRVHGGVGGKMGAKYLRDLDRLLQLIRKNQNHRRRF